MRFIRLPEVMSKTGLARSTIYKLISAGDFPAQVALGARAVAWLESDIHGWMLSKVETSQKISLSHSHLTK